MEDGTTGERVQVRFCFSVLEEVEEAQAGMIAFH